MIPERQIRAKFDADTITVYQAYKSEIALPAVANKKFVAPFKMSRMTWIKPSFLWMMYRSGWASKEGQEHILSIKIKRSGFEWALANSCLSHFDKSIHTSENAWKQQLTNSPVRVQWDPEKNIHLHNLNYRSLQVGLEQVAVELFVNDWIVDINDITIPIKTIHKHIQNGNLSLAESLLPSELPYPLPDTIKSIIIAD